MIALAFSLVVGAPFHVDVQLADPTVTATSFELPVARGAFAVQNAKTVKQANGDVLYFITNATGPDSDADFASGPISHLRTRDLPRGFGILLTPRSETSIALQGGMIVATAKAAPSAETPRTDRRKPIADDRSPMTDGRQPIADDRTPMTDGGRPVADHRSTTADDRAPIAEDLRQVAEASAPMARASAAQPIDDTRTSPLRTFGLLACLLAVGAAVVVYGKKKKTNRGHGESAGIDLIAVKALGAKQRLAVVDACGDRLLIATSEHGVQLLSKLEGGERTGVHKVPADFMATLAQAENAGPVPTTHVTPVNTSRDLAGLVQLRARRATWTATDALL